MNNMAPNPIKDIQPPQKIPHRKSLQRLLPFFLYAIIALASLLSAREFFQTINAASSEIVSGTISDASVQFGSLQRKIVYASGNWYAFYSNGTQIFYKK